jgi:hypothetical protein
MIRQIIGAQRPSCLTVAAFTATWELPRGFLSEGFLPRAAKLLALYFSGTWASATNALSSGATLSDRGDNAVGDRNAEVGSQRKVMRFLHDGLGDKMRLIHRSPLKS